MESIEIKGFLTIEYAKFEIKKINVLIGAQAQGKSVIAKLVYFFQESFSKIFVDSIKNFETKRDINKKYLASFEQIFPSYAWKNQEFSISYDYGEYQIAVTRIQKANRYTTKFEFCGGLMRVHKILKQRYEIVLKEALKEGREESNTGSLFGFMFYQEKHRVKLNSVGKKSFFIPAARSFFATIQQNIFSLLANDIEIDPFIKEFGSYYENSKVRSRNHIDNAASKKVERLTQEVIAGEYHYEDKRDWIINKVQRTNLAHASSGQQESLPMLLVLKSIPFIIGSYQHSYFFIEEPEAHLFPTSQKHIISIIATIQNTFGHSFFITTHSPYILTAINNLVVGKDAYEHAQGNPEKLEALEKVLPEDELIRLEDVSAYTLKNGRLESIIDLENRLIGANLLDSVSDEFDEAFGVATEILYGDD
ncbi:MAG: hypothetical protein RL368_94 [Pseudomonadota bacterium]|jgi:AAA15 family ATPase/GTPase